MIEEKLPKIDELARNVDRISLDVDSLKPRCIPPKHDINESLKAMKISIDECKERTDDRLSLGTLIDFRLMLILLNLDLLLLSMISMSLSKQ